MKNKVCLIGGYRLPEGNASSVRAFGNAMLLKSIGYEPVIAGKFTDGSKDELWRVYNGIDCFNVNCCNDREGITVRFADKLISELGEDDIHSLIVYNYPGLGLDKLRRLAKKHGIGMISDTTEWYAFEGKHFIDAAIRKLQTEYRMRIVNKKIGNIICSTYYIQKYYSKYHTVIIPMIDDRSFGSEREKSFKTGGIRRYVYAGSPGYRFRKDKIETIIRSFETMRDKGLPYRLDIYGITEDQYREVYEYEAVNDENFCIVFHGRVPKSEIEDALSEADFYVLFRPDTKVCRVGFSTKAMEAISWGVPLISNDVNGDFERYFTDGQALIVGARDEEGFLKALEKSAAMPDEEVIQMKKNCALHDPFHYQNFAEPVRLFMEQVSK